MAQEYVGEKKLMNDASSVVFACPACRKTTVERSLHERKLGARYVCSSCGFEGPN